MIKKNNPLTELLNATFSSAEEVELFIDNIEDELFGMSSKDFYIKYKGDIKELLTHQEENQIEWNFEREILAAFQAYYQLRSIKK